MGGGGAGSKVFKTWNENPLRTLNSKISNTNEQVSLLRNNNRISAWLISPSPVCFVDLIQAPWPEDPDENGEKKREIGYTLSLNYSIGPKVSQSSEKQVRNSAGIVRIA